MRTLTEIARDLIEGQERAFHDLAMRDSLAGLLAVHTRDEHRVTWWVIEPHAALCGAPCVGGGVEGARTASGRVTFDHAHRTSRCGVASCDGGSVSR